MKASLTSISIIGVGWGCFVSQKKFVKVFRRLSMLRASPSNGHTSNMEEEEGGHHHQPVGIYGWRKRCLYVFILFLMVLTIVNLALVIWILRVLNFSVHGMGKFRMTENGMRLEGEAEFIDRLYTGRIQSLQDKPLYIDSSKDILLRARDGKKNITSTLLVGDGKVEAQCDEFKIVDSEGKLRFKVWNKGVAMEMDEVYYTGSSKVTFNSSVETPNIRGPRAEPLKIEAPSTSINMYAKDEIRIEAPAGDMTIHSLKEIQMRSKDSIILDSAKLFIKNLKVSSGPAPSQQKPVVYQLCVCSTGLLFMADADKECQGTREICS
ncbi:delta-sarcoglycan-like [Ostrea edulis]|uniref:delta-sarcoglycan-like n=1 Tax=Ostrea edulis TaxID=37623 RepID=UPI0024AFA9B2|nr:delta-sarcoglycan-like [Ostrea edulis]